MLRAPLGQYNVGISKTDTEEFGDGKFRRKLSLMFFYPSDETGEECPYMDAEYQRKAGTGACDNGVKTYCYGNVKLSPREKRYPVVIYNHGLSGFQMESTVLCADIASNGYIVVGIGHPYGSGAVTYEDMSVFEPDESFTVSRNNLAPLGNLWYEDINFAVEFIERLNREDMSNGKRDAFDGGNRDDGPNRKIDFAGRLNLDDGISLLGVSFGGCCSVGAALAGAKIRCAINLDGGLFTDINCLYPDKPILVMCSPLNFKAHAKLKDLGCTDVTVNKIRKVTHWEFSDGIYLSDRGKQDRNRADTISKTRALRCLEFIQKH